METFALSRILRIAYPAVIIFTAATLAWTNSVQGNNTTTSQHRQPPDFNFSFQRTLASVDTSCSAKDRLWLVNSQSCPNDSEQWTIFVDGKKEHFSPEKTPMSANASN